MYAQPRDYEEDQLLRHATTLLLQAQSMGVLIRLGEAGAMMLADVPPRHIAATMDEDQVNSVIEVLQEAALSRQAGSRVPDTHAPLVQDLHLGQIPGRARGVALERTLRFPLDHSISVLAARPLVPRMAMILGHVAPAALNLANHIIGRLEVNVDISHLDLTKDEPLLKQDHHNIREPWHANVHLAFRARDRKWDQDRMFCAGVPHQPLKPGSSEPSNALPRPSIQPIVGIRLEQIAFPKTTTKREQPPAGKSELATVYQLHSAAHQQQPSPCVQHPTAHQVPMPVILGTPNPEFPHKSRTIILADGDHARPFGITNENAHSWVSSRLVAAHPALVRQ
jgi:hypothetical protein